MLTSMSASPAGAVIPAWKALALEAEELPVLEPGGDGDVERAAVRQPEAAHRTIRGLEKIDRERIMHVGTARREAMPETVAKGGTKDALEIVRPEGLRAIFAVHGLVSEVAVEAALLRPLGAARVDLAAVEARALLRVGEQRVGGGDGLEALLRVLFAGIEVGMKALGQLAVGGTDRVFGGGALNAQDLVGVFHGGGE